MTFSFVRGGITFQVSTQVGEGLAVVVVLEDEKAEIESLEQSE
jgi:hypothetical protein